MIHRVGRARNTTPALFVYGSLRSGAAQGHLLDRFAVGRKRATVPGRLDESTTAFPAARFAQDGETAIPGELVWLEPNRADEALAELDRYEGEGFRRVTVVVRTEAGDDVSAYAYEWLGRR
jgi:gamma-glutamylcyclotransferase (GGCT)/AIG2-like uncharacterized protein YtfP